MASIYDQYNATPGGDLSGLTKTGANPTGGGGSIPWWAVLGASTLGGLFTGLGQNAAAKASAAEQGREFNIGSAPGLARLSQTAPIRDRLLSALSSRFGAHPTTYAAAQAGYQPSADVADQEALYKKLLAQMGYGYGGPPVGAPPSPVDKFTQKPLWGRGSSRLGPQG